MNDFGPYLRKVRESRGMTVNQLAMYSHISSASISRYESGERRPKAENIKKLADALKYPYNQLMEGAGNVDESSDLSGGASILKEAIDLSEEKAIAKIREVFSFKDELITEEQAKKIYYFSLGVVKKDE